MIRLLQGILALTLAGTVAAAEMHAANPPQPAVDAASGAAAQSDETNLLRQIARYEEVARSDKAAHADDSHQAKTYTHLGNLYADAGLYLKAEDAMQHAITALKNGSQSDLAGEFGQLAVVQVQLGKFKQAERNEMEALRIRTLLGDPVRIAFEWRELSGVYSVQHKFKDAANYAQKALDVLGNRADVSAYDRIALNQTLGYALIGIKNCGKGIPITRDSVDLARRSFGERSASAGYAEYILGLGYWHCGDRKNAAELLESGTAKLQANFGWDRSVYVNAMKQYALFLRSTGRLEAAADAEAVVNRADAIVDARSLTGRTEGFRSAPSK